MRVPNGRPENKSPMQKRLLGPFREFGPWVGLLYIADRILCSISSSLRLHVYEFMAQPIPSKPLLPERLGKQFVIREIRRDDADVARMPPRPALDSRFEQGAICLGGYSKNKNEFVGFIWFCFREYEEDEVRYTYLLPPGGEAVFDFDLYIFPEHRLGFGFVGIWNAANEYLRNRGIKSTFSRLTRFNLASRRAHAHLGWKRVGAALCLKAWRVEVTLATIRPYFHMSLGNGYRARFDLRVDAEETHR